MTKADVAREWRAKHPDMNTTKLARLMRKGARVMFTSVEHARKSLRYIEGKTGEANKNNKVVNTPFFKKDARPLNPFALPASDETGYKPFIIRAKKLLVLSDIHIPYHSIEAITCALQFAKREKPDAILLNGDTLDFYALSKFGKDPRKRHFGEELKAFKGLIDVIKKTFPAAKLYLKLGNHEERYMHFLWMKAKELEGVDEFQIENIISARANGITIIKDKRIIKVNGLNIIHGHEFSTGFFSPVNVARGLFLRGKTSAMQGHSHQTSEHTEPDMNSKITTCWSTGCLCELHPEWMPINKWNHGFAIVELHGKNFTVRNFRIKDGKIL